MPLYVADIGSLGPRTLLQVPEKFIVFYASIVHGEMWCPDCRAVESLVKDTFDQPDAPAALIVHVGDKSQWKSPLNPFRGDPWQLESIPTIVKMENGKEAGRLVEGEITTEKLADFVKD